MVKRVEPFKNRKELIDIVPLDTPITVHIDMSGACNINCYFCPNHQKGFISQERHKIMELPLFKKIVEDMKLFPKKVKVVYLHAFGEPLVNKNIVTMIKSLKSSGVCEEIRMVSNGILLTKTLINDLVDSGLTRLVISLNGLDANKYKEDCKADINFELLVENIKHCFQKSRGKFELLIKTTNSVIQNDEDFQLLNNYFEDSCDYLIVEDIVELWSDFKQEFPPEETNTDYKLWMQQEREICAISLITMVIHSNGWISPCAVDWNFALKYGDARHENLVDIWNSKRLNDLQLQLLNNKFNTINACKGCTFRSPDKIDSCVNEIIEKYKNRSDLK